MTTTLTWQRLTNTVVLTILSLGLLLSFGQIGQAQTSQGNPFSGMPQDKQDCIKRALGETRFNELSSGGQFNDSDSQAVGSAGCFENTTTVGESKVTPTKVNPFENLTESHKQCLKDALGARFDALTAGEAWTQQDQETIQKTVCVVSNYQPPSGYEQNYEGKYKESEYKKEEFQPDAELETCVEGVLGAERFAEMKSGAQPTPGEMEQVKKKCFSSDKYKDKYVKNVETNDDFSSFEKCFGLVIGQERLQQMKNTGEFNITEEERAKAYECMGKDPHPAAPRPEINMSATLEKCLQDGVGQEAFNAISKGGREPTADERAKGEACFGAEHEGKKAAIKPENVLPPPPEQVPFVKEDKTVSVGNAQTSGEKIEFEGTLAGAKEGQVVDVYIYSEDPKQVTATVGKNGKWTLSYDGDLAQGQHKVYAVARKAGELIRSAAKTFSVGAAKAQTKDKEQTETVDLSNSLIYYLGAIFGVAAAALIVFLLARRHHV